MPFKDRLDVATLGHWLMDAEHRHLVVLMNEVEFAITAGKDEAQIRVCFDKLVAWAKLHFTHENDSIQRSGYDGTARHVAQHSELLQALADYSATEPVHAFDRRLRAVDVLRFFEDWLVSHIENEDVPLAAYLSRKGSRA
jgi:hemerythrin-like metal-binding protein